VAGIFIFLCDQLLEHAQGKVIELRSSKPKYMYYNCDCCFLVEVGLWAFILAEIQLQSQTGHISYLKASLNKMNVHIITRTAKQI